MPETNTSTPFDCTATACEKWPPGSTILLVRTCCFGMALGYTGPRGGSHEAAARSACLHSLFRSRAELSCQAGAHDRAFPAGRNDRSDRAHRAAEIPGVPRPDGGDR